MKIKKTKIVENLTTLREATGDDDDLDLSLDGLDDLDNLDDLDGLDDLDDLDVDDKPKDTETPANPKDAEPVQNNAEPAQKEPTVAVPVTPKVEPQADSKPVEPAETSKADTTQTNTETDTKTLPSGDVVGTTTAPSKPKKVRQVVDLGNLLDLHSGNLPKNAVYAVLNRSLRDSKIATIKQRVKKKPDANFARDFNILVEGLPGGGKTATIKAWADANGINLVAVNAKDPDLELAINGAVMRDLSDDNNKNSIVMAYSKLLAPLEEPNSVLFLDEYNRQTDDQIRASLLTLVGEHCIYGDVAGSKSEKVQGYHFFKNMLFTVAAINPAVPQDRGAAKLNDAEMSRFLRRVKFDSTPAFAASYFKWYYDRELNDIVEANKDATSADEAYAWVYATTFLQKHIALFLTTNPSFKFDDEADLQPLYNGGKTMFNQRLLTQLISSLVYHPDATMADQILDYIGEINPLNLSGLPDQKEDEKRDWSNILDKDKKMIVDILKDYKQPIVEVPGFGDITNINDSIDDEEIDPDSLDDELGDPEATLDELEKQVQDGEEIDNDLFGNGNITDSGSAGAISTGELDAIAADLSKEIDDLSL